jgi:hypothetical protein
MSSPGPTNQDILEATQAVSVALQAHTEEDNKRLENLATKDDIKEMQEAFNDFIKALKVFRSTSKWGYRALLVVSSVVIAVVTIGGGFKTIIGWFK